MSDGEARTSKGVMTMATYRVMLIREMSQAFDLEATDAKAAAVEAIDQNSLSANVSNDYDDSGEVEVFSIIEVAADGSEKVVFDREQDGEIDLR